MDALLAAAGAWLSQDPDPETHDELAKIVEANDEAALRERFGSRLQFGTAGLRGELGAGPNRMNRVLVAQAAAGLAAFLNATWETHPSVVIGFDGRINSRIFAEDSARILAGAGIKVYLFDEVCPTPMLAFALKQLDASAGVMVTASHNPPRDNGYKVYLGGFNGGSQIVSPTDKQIAAEIEAVAASSTFATIKKSDDYEIIGPDLRAAYIAGAAQLVDDQDGQARKPLKIVYTAMHGVGWATAEPLFRLAGLGELIPVTEQRDPDGAFPTVAFPNPEEPGAMDLAFKKGSEVGADLVIANDPDADRFAVAIPDCTFESGWRRLTGDEVGLILGDELANQAVAHHRKGRLACSIVSSGVLEKVAAHYGLEYAETLTGFKWVAKVPDLIFGFEEALGYCVDVERVADKDGITAALVFADLVSRLAAKGKSVEHLLDELGQRYGYYLTSQISIRVEDLSIIANTVARLRANPPAKIAGADAKFTDFSLGAAGLPPTDGLRFDLDDNRRVIVRPSGTEPKLKCYLQSVGASIGVAKTGLATLDAAMRKLLEG